MYIYVAFGGYDEEENTLSPDPANIDGGARVDDLSSITIDDSGGTAHEPTYKPVLDIQRFQKLLEQEGHSSPSSRSTSVVNNIRQHRRNVGVSRGLDTTLSRQVYVDETESGHGGEARREVCSPGAAKVRFVGSGSGDGGSGGRGSGDVENTTAVSELSSIPMDPAVQRRGGNMTVDSEAIRMQPLPAQRIPQQGNHAATRIDHPLLVSRKMLVQHGSSCTPGFAETGFGGEVHSGHMDPTLHSKRTSKIHADLTRLEKVRYNTGQIVHAPFFYSGVGVFFLIRLFPKSVPVQMPFSLHFFPPIYCVQLVHGLDQELAAHKRSVTKISSSSSLMSSMKHTSAEVPSSPPAGGGKGLGTEAVFSLLRDVKQQLEHSQSQLMGEVEVRGQFLQTLTDQQDLMDTLTAVSMTIIMR